MRWFESLRQRTRSLVGRHRLESDLDAELRFHIDQQIEENLSAGMDVQEARTSALRSVGSIALLKQQCRDSLGLRLLDDGRQDLRYALRQFRKHPGFTAVAVFTLALGVGANTAIFSVVNAVLLRPLPYHGADQLVTIAGALPAPGMTASEIATLASRSETLTHIGVYFPFPRTMISTGGNAPVRLDGIELTPSILEMVAAQPLLGRVFASHEGAPGADRLVILSHATWQRMFAGDPHIVGKSLALDGNGYSVIGVMPRTFQFPDSHAQFWIPLSWPSPVARLIPTARLKEGLSVQAATDEVNTIVQQLRENGEPAVQPPPPPAFIPSLAARGFTILRMRDQLVGPVRPALRILAVAVGFVLLIACVNVANLLLARMASRQREIAIRHAIGAGRGRLIRQMITESTLLALLSAAVAVVVGFAGLALLRRLGAGLPRRDVSLGVGMPRLEEIGIDSSVLLFTLTIALIAGLAFGLAPAIRQARVSRMDAIRGGAPAGSGFNVFRRNRLQALLVITQIGAAMVLLIGGGLLVRSFVKLVSVNPGYDTHNVLTFRVRLPRLRYPVTFPEDVVERLRSVPGTAAAGYARVLPMVYAVSTVTLSASPPAPNQMPTPPPPPTVSRPREFPDARVISRDYLDAMGIRVVAGRGFVESDRAGRPQVMLINQTLASSGLFGSDPIGKQTYALGALPWEIVGIVGDSRQFLDAVPTPQVFFDNRQVPRPATSSAVAQGPLPYFVVRVAKGSAPTVSSLIEAVRQLDPQATIDDVATMEQLVSNSLSRQRLYAVLLGIFAAAAVVLAAIGLYGVVAYSVTQRTREMGIRIALGARRMDVMGLVLSETAVLATIGMIVGVVGAAAVTRYLQSLLFGITPLDSTTFIQACTLFVLTAMLAALVPSRRAMSVDPLVALRCE